ncbi:2-C-methyl-D-erythritol 2,4-cyclodiphosphate synthase, partial [Citrobacter freundii]|uniref:2-C-methyl-D-erythritol 2,4-cyclodiphosphate synthase n=1 Tax=Citrobacter freundii TaxID=546 RepID=UPI0021C6D847|nr:2-C-methyl-D-erythritol 2,4-cyclodiphosphate synthase [Citrobacter freundii]
MRIGQGMDVHAFEAGDFVTLAGIQIPHTHGLKAHSDGDVVLHALCDALLGALALGDIGQHFPDTDPEYKGADSRVLLKHVYQLILDRGYQLNNADITVA